MWLHFDTHVCAHGGPEGAPDRRCTCEMGALGCCKDRCGSRCGRGNGSLFFASIAAGKGRQQLLRRAWAAPLCSDSCDDSCRGGSTVVHFGCDRRDSSHYGKSSAALFCKNRWAGWPGCHGHRSSCNKGCEGCQGCRDGWNCYGCRGCRCQIFHCADARRRGKWRQF